ncbi:DUF4397 domain-containing protein [Anaerolentibacter hominis]|uniref:DUF4397 domain-containing protein n=1 Tax=Anaerolentibacter hominis TaxID=3079009 RepID=UPI0031B8800A
MNEFVSLPLTAAQMPDEPIDPGFSVPDTEIIGPAPDNTIDPDFSVVPPVYPIDPDFSVMPPNDTIDPDFSVMPPNEPVDPDFSVMPPVYPVVPCLYCNNNQWVRGAIRLLNAATGYNAFNVLIDGRLAAAGFNFPEITRYRQLTQGWHTFTVMGTNGYIFVRKSLYVGDGMATVAIINARTGLDLTMIEDTTCPANYNSACFRVCNLAYYSGPVNAAIGNIYYNAVNFKTAASFSPLAAGSYTLTVARSARPEVTLVSTTVRLNPRRIYTAYVLNWNTSPDTIQTLLVEDRRS